MIEAPSRGVWACLLVFQPCQLLRAFLRRPGSHCERTARRPGNNTPCSTHLLCRNLYSRIYRFAREKCFLLAKDVLRVCPPSVGVVSVSRETIRLERQRERMFHVKHTPSLRPRNVSRETLCIHRPYTYLTRNASLPSPSDPACKSIAAFHDPPVHPARPTHPGTSFSNPRPAYHHTTPSCANEVRLPNKSTLASPGCFT